MKTNVHFFIYICGILLRMRNVSDKICRENQNTHFMPHKFLSQKYFLLLDNVEGYGTVLQAIDDNITWRMDFAF
jgi:hypothetical protein